MSPPAPECQIRLHLSLLISLALLAIVFSGALGAKTVSGSITVDTVWDTVGGRFYNVTGTVIVQSGATLTIDPGVVVKFNNQTGLYVHGTLYAFRRKVR